MSSGGVGILIHLSELGMCHPECCPCGGDKAFKWHGLGRVDSQGTLTAICANCHDSIGKPPIDKSQDLNLNKEISSLRRAINRIGLDIEGLRADVQSIQKILE